MDFGQEGKKTNRRRTYLFTAGVLLFIGAVVSVAIIVLLTSFKSISDTDSCKVSSLATGAYPKAAISCDAPYCADIGKAILQKGGSVADAAIATLVCMGVVHSQSSGIGGGFLLVMYNATTKQSHVFNGREVAPIRATKNMHKGNSTLSTKGALAVAVPGEIKGYMELHKASGVLPWAELFQPTIQLCKSGFNVSATLGEALYRNRDYIPNEKTLAEIFINPETNNVYAVGETMRRPKLAETLEKIAYSEIGGNELYTGELAQLFVDDLKEMGGIIEMKDMENYRVATPEPIVVNLKNGLTLHTIPPPGSGILLAFMLQLLDGDLSIQDKDRTVTYQRIAETFKHTYALRTKMGDPFDASITDFIKQLVHNMTDVDFISAIRQKIQNNSTSQDYAFYGAEYYQPEDHGTAHLSILSENGDAIAVTTTVNLLFGAKIRSSRTGIIYNDQMDDFSAPNITNAFGVPPSPNNFILPGKRPMSSTCPTIFTDVNGRVRLALGGAGGTRITTSVAQVAIRNLWFESTIQEAVDSFRIHHQLYPMAVQPEMCFPKKLAQGLEDIGHKVQKITKKASVSAVSRAENDNTIYAKSDFRKSGSVAGY